MQDGKAPLENSKRIELHHIGQKMENPFAELTMQEHRGKDTDRILHDKTKPTQIDRKEFTEERHHYWKTRTQEILKEEIKKMKSRKKK